MSGKIDFKNTKQLEILAIELALAGGQVLVDSFNFTPAQVAQWTDLLLEQAKYNRAGNLPRMQKIVAGIDK